MQPFTTHTGMVAPVDRVNVDTDQMVPKQFLKALTRDGFGRILFYDWRYLAGEKPNPEFVLNSPRYLGASVLLTRAKLRRYFLQQLLQERHSPGHLDRGGDQRAFPARRN